MWAKLKEEKIEYISFVSRTWQFPWAHFAFPHNSRTAIVNVRLQQNYGRWEIEMPSDSARIERASDVRISIPSIQTILVFGLILFV